MTYHYLGLYFNKRDNFDLAQRAFQMAVDLDPKFSPSYGFLKKPRIVK
ncbi:MAG: hypothetical protein WCH62_04430 [Candidatus Omnitrophota bacterium]